MPVYYSIFMTYSKYLSIIISTCLAVFPTTFIYPEIIWCILMAIFTTNIRFHN